MRVQTPHANIMFPMICDFTCVSLGIPRAQTVLAMIPGVARFELNNVR